MDIRDDEGFPEHLDHRNRRAHARLEAELDTRGGRGREELRSALRDELLVRRDDGLACGEQLEHVAPGRVDSAHHLRHDGDRGVVADRLRVRRQDAGVGPELALLLEIADERADDTQAVPGGALDVVRALDEQAVDGGADRPVAEEADSDVDASQPSPPTLPVASDRGARSLPAR